jgi:hypothetical protein
MPIITNWEDSREIARWTPVSKHTRPDITNGIAKQREMIARQALEAPLLGISAASSWTKFRDDDGGALSSE